MIVLPDNIDDIRHVGREIRRQQTNNRFGRRKRCGDQCSPEEFVEKKMKWNAVKWLTRIPHRMGHLFRIKCNKISAWFRPPEHSNTTLTREETLQPFLELIITFTPSNEKAILYYFQAISVQKLLGVHVEFEKIEEMLQQGSNINARDELGQTVLHDACREEGLETIKYLIDKGSAINTMDMYGRTPLHIAAAFDNYKIIEYLIEGKADYGAITHGDVQTPLHYAAKNDAPASCRALIEYGSNIEARDYRGRTPLLLAAELDRSVAASTLLDHGASVKILDYTGYHPVCAMIKNMPGVAVKGLDQFYTVNKTTRQEFFWLNYLEPSLISSEGGLFPSPSVLEEVVLSGNQELIKHPVIKEMISTKWSQFGIFGTVYDFILYIFTLIIWSLLVLSKPYAKDGSYQTTFNIVIAVISALLYLIQLCEELAECYKGFKTHENWKAWKLQQIQGDIQYVLPKNVEEREYLADMEEKIKKTKSPYLSDFWNIYDWCFLTMTGLTFILYVVYESFHSNEYTMWPLGLWKSRFLSLSLITAWIRLFKYMKVFESMGPFVVIMSNSINDFTKISFVYFVLYIPATCVFYQFYGKSGIPAYSDSIPDVMFTVFRMIVVDEYFYDDILTWGEDNGVTQAWTHVIISYWLLASSIILLNLFIALMSDTFQRIYDKAIEVAAIERAETIVTLEKKLSYKRREQFLKYIKRNFSPKILYFEDENQITDLDEGKVSVRNLTKVITEQVRTLSDITSSEPEVEGIKNTLAEQEVALRKALGKLADIAL